MPTVNWTSPGISGNWDDAADWTGLLGIFYPGQLFQLLPSFPFLKDNVTIGANASLGSSGYIVTFNVPSVTISSLEIDGGIGAANSTTLELQGGNVLTIQGGGVTFVLNEASAVIDGSGTIDLEGGLIGTLVSPKFPGGILAKGLFMAGTDTTGGILELAGTGSVPSSSSIVFAISTAAPSTLRFDLAGTVVSTEEITIDNANQTLEVGRFATLDINARQNVIGGTIVMSGGTLADTLGGINFGNSDSGGFLSGFGTVAGRLSTSLGQVPSIILAIGGNLTLTDIIERAVGLEFDIGGTAASVLQLDGSVNEGNTFTFLGAAGELAFTPANGGLKTTLTGLNVGSTLTHTNFVDFLRDPGVTVTSGQIGSGTFGAVALSNGDILSLQGITNASGTWFVNTAPDSNGTGTELFLSTVCYVRGTMIACPDGERAVETLSIGDQVLTSDGRVMPVRWIGRNTVSTRFADPLRVLPIRIRAGALADHLPVRDLLVSPEHAVLVDDILIQAGALVNGLSIVRESNVAETFVYYHIELADHALVLAEGTPAESFVDNIHRMAFDNWEEHEALYGDAPIVEMDYPRARSHRQVPMEIRARLLDRAATMPASQREIAA